MNKALLLLAMPMLLAGCYKVNVTGLSNDGAPGRNEIVPAHTLIYGMISLNDVDARDVCGDSGVWSVTTKYNAISWLAAGLTGGIYIPMYADVTCRS